MKTVCHDCIGNKHLKRFINDKKERNVCDYCGKNKHSVSLDELVEEILECIYIEFEHADDVLGYNSKEGGYQGTTYDTFDLIKDELYDELSIHNEVLQDDIIDGLNTKGTYVWCERDYYWGAQHIYDESLWNKFSKLVKYQVRYVADRIKDGKEDDERTSSNILDEIGKYVREPRLELLKEFKKRHLEIYRGRVHSCKEKFTDKSNFYPPPREKANAGRMNPDGIPMFYGALDHITIQKELYSEISNCLSIAKFINTKNLLILDLTDLDLSKLPSIFDRDKHMLRDSYIFLSFFAKEISKKIDDEYNIEYIPTQIVTEYFRHCFTMKKRKIDGILYPSSKNQNGKNIVLFVDTIMFSNNEAFIKFQDNSIVLYTKEYI